MAHSLILQGSGQASHSECHSFWERDLLGAQCMDLGEDMVISVPNECVCIFFNYVEVAVA